MAAYEEQLRHVAEPQAPTERESATSVTIEDYEALWFTDVLREFAHYGDTEGTESKTAVAYASYIDQKIRGEGASQVALYVHTDEAQTTLLKALDYYLDEMANHSNIILSLDEAFNSLIGDDGE